MYTKTDFIHATISMANSYLPHDNELITRVHFSVMRFVLDQCSKLELATADTDEMLRMSPEEWDMYLEDTQDMRMDQWMDAVRNALEYAGEHIHEHIPSMSGEEYVLWEVFNHESVMFMMDDYGTEDPRVAVDLDQEVKALAHVSKLIELFESDYDLRLELA